MKAEDFLKMILKHGNEDLPERMSGEYVLIDFKNDEITFGNKSDIDKKIGKTGFNGNKTKSYTYESCRPQFYGSKNIHGYLMDSAVFYNVAGVILSCLGLDKAEGTIETEYEKKIKELERENTRLKIDLECAEDKLNRYKETFTDVELQKELEDTKKSLENFMNIREELTSVIIAQESKLSAIGEILLGTTVEEFKQESENKIIAEYEERIEELEADIEKYEEEISKREEDKKRE